MRLFALSIIFFALPVLAFGEIVPTLTTSIQIQAIPEAPAAGASVIFIVSGVYEKNTLTYTWEANGEVIAEGIGIDRVTVETGRVGEALVVSVRVENESGLVLESSRTISPAEVDVVWEANTYTPPFYPGRALPTGESTITVSAVPDIRTGGARIPRENLIYEWYINNRDTPFQSGFGLHTIEVTPPLFDSAFTVSVIAKTRSGDVEARNSVTIVPEEPVVMLYEQHPLLGVLFNRAVGERFALTGEEMTLRLFPLFVVDASATEYSWDVNGTAVDPGPVVRELTLRRTGGGSGFATVRGAIETAGSLYEQAEKTARLVF